MVTIVRAFFFFFFNDTATTEIYTLSLHDALPIFIPTACPCGATCPQAVPQGLLFAPLLRLRLRSLGQRRRGRRSEEHTSELQSQSNLVCRLLLEKKKSPLDRYRSAARVPHSQSTA